MQRCRRAFYTCRNDHNTLRAFPYPHPTQDCYRKGGLRPCTEKAAGDSGALTSLLQPHIPYYAVFHSQSPTGRSYNVQSVGAYQIAGIFTNRAIGQTTLRMAYCPNILPVLVVLRLGG